MLRSVTLRDVLNFSTQPPTEKNCSRFADLCGSGSPEGWRREWHRLAPVTMLFSLRQSRESDGHLKDVDPSRPADEPIWGVAIDIPEGEMLYCASDREGLGEKLGALVAAGMSRHAPRVRYANEPGRGVVALIEGDGFFRAWGLLQRFYAGELEARQCCVCGLWEEKGKGYRRNTWIQHASCGNAKHQRWYRESLKREDEEWKRESR